MVTCTETHLSNITTKLVFVLQTQEITVTETKSMCWQVFSNKYINDWLWVLEYIVLWTRCVILVVTIANSGPPCAPMNSDDAIVDSRWRHNCCHWLWLKEVTQIKQWSDLRLTSWLASQLDEFALWIRLDLDPNSLKWDSFRVQAKCWVKSQVKWIWLQVSRSHDSHIKSLRMWLRLCEVCFQGHMNDIWNPWQTWPWFLLNEVSRSQEWHSEYLKNMAKIFVKYFCQSLNSSWLSDVIRWHRSGSKLAQVMACCLTAPNHYLNQHLSIISDMRFSDIYLRAKLQRYLSHQLLKLAWKLLI